MKFFRWAVGKRIPYKKEHKQYTYTKLHDWKNIGSKLNSNGITVFTYDGIFTTSDGE